jgi:hypothetical protein
MLELTPALLILDLDETLIRSSGLVHLDTSNPKFTRSSAMFQCRGEACPLIPT